MTLVLRFSKFFEATACDKANGEGIGGGGGGAGAPLFIPFTSELLLPLVAACGLV